MDTNRERLIEYYAANRESFVQLRMLQDATQAELERLRSLIESVEGNQKSKP